MFNHEPDGYACPFCRLVGGGEDERRINTQQDVVRRTGPAGNQDAWHYRVHDFPRYAGDELYGSHPYPEFVTAEQRRPYAERLRAAWPS